jgi:hypothetical protein
VSPKYEYLISSDNDEDMIIRGGMNIASAAVEAVISEGTNIDVSFAPYPVA